MPITGLEADLRVAATDILFEAGQAIMDALVEAAPVGETGELRDSAYGPAIDESTLTVTVGFEAPQADWTNEGTPPHGEDGNPVMTFFWENGPNGAGVYSFTHVNHPGIVASHWFDDIIEEWDSYVEDAAS